MTRKRKVIIVDDEPLAREVLESHVGNLNNLELIASCKNALEAKEIISKEDVDIAFLDIQMPQVTGLELTESIKSECRVILTTAFSEYALEGFELDVTDYLLKPISIERFKKSVERAIAELELLEGDENGIETEADYMFVKADKKLVKVKYEDVLYIEGLKDYVIIRRDEDRVITLQTMKYLEKTLPEKYFKRVHRSYIIALNKIMALNNNSIEIMEKGKRKNIPIGKNYKEGFFEIIDPNKL